MSALIIAYGNPLRGDDGFGWMAAERLAALLPADVEILAKHQLLPELVPAISRAERVLFIDVEEGPEAGQLRVQQLTPLAFSASAFSHHCSPELLLGWAKMLHGVTPRAYLVTVTANHFPFAERLSEPVTAALPALVAEVERLLAPSLSVPD